MSGMMLTLANPKPDRLDRLGTEIKALLQNTENSEYKLCSFDVSQEELVIIAAYNSAEYCRFEDIKPDALATEGAQFVLLGSSKDKTDAHSKLAQRFNISRGDSKTLGLSLAYGSGLVSCCNLLRPSLGNKYSEKELKILVSDYIKYFKGTRARGDYLWQGGIFSHFFNYAQWLIQQPVPRLPFGGQAITNTLRPEHCGRDYHTSRMNWTVQGTGSYILDCLIYYIDQGIYEAGLEDLCWYQFSVHDMLGYFCHQSATKEWAAITRKAYAKVWKMFFRSLNMECPQQVLLNLELAEDVIDRKEPQTNVRTMSGAEFLNGIKPGVNL
jgi:hypothetical protein